jgi:hypothetical protein
LTLWATFTYTAAPGNHAKHLDIYFGMFSMLLLPWREEVGMMGEGNKRNMA